MRDVISDLYETIRDVFGPIALIVVLFFGGCSGASYIGSKIHVADGYRDSTIRRISETGVVWKTHELESLGDGTRQVVNDKSTSLVIETFKYTVPPEVVNEIKEIPPGQRVRIHYRKNLMAWYPNGESNYFITRVEVLK